MVNKPKTIGISNCVAPPPRLPQPALVALAVPTTFEANMIDVWYCVMTNEAPMPPIRTRNNKKVSNEWASPIPITGSDPMISNQV